VTPYAFQEPLVAELPAIAKTLGEPITADGDHRARAHGCFGDRIFRREVDRVQTPPEYRNDYLHQVDVAEDVIIGRGMKSFAPEMPADFTVGRLSESERSAAR
jgi:phenylalanyl-tRNA synthetase beta chain